MAKIGDGRSTRGGGERTTATVLRGAAEQECWRRLRDRASRVLAGFAHQIEEATREDLAQEAIARLLQAEAVLDPEPFVAQVARRLAIDHLRRERVRAAEPFAEDLGDLRWLVVVEARILVREVTERLPYAPASFRALLAGLVLHGRTMADLVEEEAGPDAAQVVRRRARETVYRRRSRAFAWVRANAA